MTTAKDYLTSSLASLQSARSEILALSTLPNDPINMNGFTKACPNHADAKSLAQALAYFVDVEDEIKLAINMI